MMYHILFISLFMMGAGQAQAQFKIKVVDQFLMPVPQALVLIGSEQDVPFVHNLLTADAGGEIQIPDTWINQEHVTVDAPGYIRQTLMNQTPSDIIVHLNPLQLNPQIYVSGTVNDLPVVNKDKLVDFAVVLTHFTQNDFVHIKQEQFISPYADEITLLGKSAPVFSNVSLPEQKENYVIPMTLTKPTYTKFVTSTGDKKLISLSGQFPFKQVADELKGGKSFFDVINYFEITSLGNLNLKLNKNTTNANFSGVTLQLDEQTTLRAPAIGSDEQALILPMNAVSNYFLPSGIKKLNSSEKAQFNTLDHTAVSILAMVKRTADFSLRNEQNRLSALFAKPTDVTASLYLPLLDNPSTQSLYPVSVTTTILNAPHGLYASGTMAVLSQVSETLYKEQTVKLENPQWEVFSLNWEHNIQLPKWPLDITLPKAVVKKFETTYFAQGQTPQNQDIKGMLDHATHLTKSAVDLQY
jgi:hypothetical protein